MREDVKYQKAFGGCAHEGSIGSYPIRLNRQQHGPEGAYFVVVELRRRENMHQDRADVSEDKNISAFFEKPSDCRYWDMVTQESPDLSRIRET